MVWNEEKRNEIETLGKGEKWKKVKSNGLSHEKGMERYENICLR